MCLPLFDNFHSWKLNSACADHYKKKAAADTVHEGGNSQGQVVYILQNIEKGYIYAPGNVLLGSIASYVVTWKYEDSILASMCMQFARGVYSFVLLALQLGLCQVAA